ncbi:MAG: hypothetical protein K0Q79_1328 [Flavipsychrobacter sp.]|jgi:hypothetical protein|nr:hypothetical protein [Flavipsychrobacter sp.]
MKKLIITCALVSLGSFASFAQSRVTRTGSADATTSTATTATPEQMAELRAKQYKKDLSLTAEQYTPIYDALLDYYRQDKIAREAGGAGPGQAMQMQMGLDQRFQAALTPAQYTKYTSLPKKL